MAQTELPLAAQETLALARQNCPVATGELLESGTVENYPDGSEVAFKAPHAIYVHERLDVAHTNGGPKFLERAFLEVSAGVSQRLRAKLEDELGNLG